MIQILVYIEQFYPSGRECHLKKIILGNYDLDKINVHRLHPLPIRLEGWFIWEYHGLEDPGGTYHDCRGKWNKITEATAQELLAPKKQLLINYELLSI